MISRRAAASATVRPMGPFVASPLKLSPIGACDTRPRDGLIPTKPQQAAGPRIEPPPSEPWAIAHNPAATAAAAPPLEPPGVYSKFQGFLAGGNPVGSV